MTQRPHTVHTTHPGCPYGALRRMQWRHRMAAACVLGAVLSGCASVAPEPQLSRLQARHDLRLSATPAEPSAEARPAVWLGWQDPPLEQLLVLAQSRALELKAAVAALQEARALAGLARREGLPQGSLGLGAQVSRASQPEVDPYRLGYPRPPEQRLISLGQALNWEIDLFGRVGTAQAVAEREVDMRQADLDGAHALLQADVVRRYIELRTAQQSQALSTRQMEVLTTRLAQVNHRVASGLMDRRERQVIEAELAHQEAASSAAQAQVQQALAAIAVLCGHSPADLTRSVPALSTPRPLPAVPNPQVIPLRDDWLARLPSVARADAALRASLGEEALAERAHLPRLSLAATLGLNEQASRLGRPSAMRYAAGPSLQWDWLDAGRRDMRAVAAQAGSARAWADFERSVLQAIADGESALSAWQAQHQGWEASQRSLASATESDRHARARQQVGLEPMLNALDSASRHLAVQQTVLQQHANTLLAHVQLELALGMWPPRTEPTSGSNPAP